MSTDEILQLQLPANDAIAEAERAQAHANDLQRRVAEQEERVRFRRNGGHLSREEQLARDEAQHEAERIRQQHEIRRFIDGQNHGRHKVKDCSVGSHLTHRA